MAQTSLSGGTPVNGIFIQPSSQPLMSRQGLGVVQPNEPRRVPGLKGLAVVHIVLGVLSAILGIVAIILRCWFSYSGMGVWAGIVFFSLTGILGILGVLRKSNKSMVVSFMVMSIISSVVACAMMILTAVGASNEQNYYCNPTGDYSNPFGSSCIVSKGPRIAVGTVMAIVALGEMVVCIVSASLSCYGICRCCNSYTPVVVQYVPQQASTQFVPLVNMQPQQQQQQQQQQLQQQRQQQQVQPVPVPTPVQGSVISSPYVTGYSVTPTQPTGLATTPQQMGTPHQQQLGVSPQFIAYAPQPVSSTPPVGTPTQQGWGTPQQTQVPPQQAGVAPLQVGVAPQQVVISATGQATPTTTMEAEKQTSEVQDATEADAAIVGGNEPFNNDKQGLLETA